MPRALFTNNARTTLAVGISAVATAITVVDGSVFPSPSAGDWAYLTLEYGTSIEIVKLTARSGNNLTVQRAQDGTSATAFSEASVSLRITKAVLDEIHADILAAALTADWATVSGKPSTFPPSAHTHAIADVTGLQTALDGKAAVSHTHSTSDITGLGTAALKNIGTSGDAVPLLNAANTWSALQIHTVADESTNTHRISNSATSRRLHLYAGKVGSQNGNLDLDAQDGNSVNIQTSGVTRLVVNSTTATFTGTIVGPNGQRIGGSYQAGSLGYTDANWGFIFRPPVVGAVGAHGFTTSGGAQILRLQEDLQSVFSGPVYAVASRTAGGVLESLLTVQNTSTGNSAQIRFLTSRDWSVLANGSLGGSNFVIRDNTSGEDRLSIAANGVFRYNTASANQNLFIADNTNGVDSGRVGLVAINDANSSYTPLGYLASNHRFWGKVGLNGEPAGAQLRIFQVSNQPIASAPDGAETGIEILGNGGAALMTFHRPGAFATYFGLDSDNRFKVGGWSYGAASYPIAIRNGPGAVSGNTSWGTAAPGTLAVGEVYLRYA